MESRLMKFSTKSQMNIFHTSTDENLPVKVFKGTRRLKLFNRIKNLYTFLTNPGLLTGIIQTCFCTGMFSGPIIGSALVPFGGYSAPFLVAGGLEALFSCIAILIFPPAAKRYSPTNHPNESEHYLKFFVTFSTMSVVIPSLVVFLMSGFRDAAYSLHFHEAIGIDLGSMGYVFASNALAATITGRKLFHSQFLSVYECMCLLALTNSLRQSYSLIINSKN